MGEYDNYTDNENEDDAGDGSQLVKDLRKQLNAAQKELKQFRTEKRSTTVSDVLSKRGINPKVAALIPADVEPTQEAVTAWLDEFGDVFGVAQGEKAPDGKAPAQTTEEAPSGVDADVASQWQQIQDSEHAGVKNAAVGTEEIVQKLESAQGGGFDAIVELLKGVTMRGGSD